jgi:putative SOS response-associated peptidase YedK
MCGRAKLPTDYSEIKIKLRFDDRWPAPNLKQSWNIAPTDPMLTAVLDKESGTRRPILMKWGLIPFWSKDGKMKHPTFNAKAETVTKLPRFKNAWEAGRRCLVVAGGFYEWRKGDKQPFAIPCADGLTIMAGLWEKWKSPAGEKINSCTIITTDANELLAPLHNRMPVILTPEDWPAWLGEREADQDELRALLKPAPNELLHLWPVSKRVGSVKNNDASLSEPVTLVA